MSTYKFNPKHLYENTNAGLDIIFKYCPQAVGCERTNKLFKLREDEDTASASLLLKEDCWIVKDFGDKGYNPIELCRYFTGFSFIEALKHLYSEFQLSDEKNIFVSDTTFKTNPLPLSRKSGFGFNIFARPNCSWNRGAVIQQFADA